MDRAEPDVLRQHGHERVPIETATGRRFDIRSEDPEHTAIWERLHGRCRVGDLVCGACDPTAPQRFLYLRVRHGRREICGYSKAELRKAGVLESDEHHALKDKVCTLAEREGLTAEQEVAGPGRRRLTDVVVSGGVRPVAWEVQLASITPDSVKKRTVVAGKDGLVSSWLTMKGAPGYSALIDRAPACSTTSSLAADEIATAEDLRIFQGLKRLEIERCTHRSESWHRGLTCTGYHARPAPLDPDGHPALSRMITATASGDIVTIRWPRRTLLHNKPWLWVSQADATAFYEVERPSLERAGMHPDPDTVLPGDSAGWHISEPAVPPVPAVGYYPSGQILGNQCPRCGWYRNQHHWDCPTGLATAREPRFDLFWRPRQRS